MPKHMQQTSYAHKCGVNSAPWYNVDVACVKDPIQFPLDPQWQGCNRVAHIPTADFDKQRLRCITAYSSPRKCVRSLLWNTLASGAKHVRLYRYTS